MSDGIELTDDEYDTFMAVLAEQRCQHSHADTACPPPPERAILTDLIAELRAQHYTDQCDCGCEQWYECKPCAHIGLCPTQEAAVRAGVRLREVTGDE